MAGVLGMPVTFLVSALGCVVLIIDALHRHR